MAAIVVGGLAALLMPTTGVASQFARLGTERHGIAAEGNLVVFSARSGVVTVVDTKTAKRQQLHVGARCGVVSVRGNLVLSNCPGAEPNELLPTLLSVVTGTAHRVPFTNGFEPLVDRVGVFGKDWLFGYTCGQAGGDCTQTYLNWHDGRVAKYPDGPIRNLDSPALTPYGSCGPVTNLSWTDLPYRLSLGGAGLLLHKCHSTVARLSRCSGSCEAITLANGVVSWSTGTRAYAYRISSGHRTSVTLPTSDHSPFQPILLHTKYSLIAGVPPSAIGGSWTLWRTKLAS